MKKVLFLVVLAILVTAGSVFAQSGIQIINLGNQNSSSGFYIDDVKKGSEYQIDGFGIIKVLNTDTWDKYFNSEGYRDGLWNGRDEADSLILQIKITNITLKPKNYLDNVSVKIIYDDQFEIKGWWVQHTCVRSDSYDSAADCYISSSQEIDPFYEGFYTFGAKVPNFIVKDSKPLRMEVTIDDVELTYHIRK